MEYEEAVKAFEKEFGSQYGYLAHQIITLSMTGQPCDITFLEKKPILDVKINQQTFSALVSGAGPQKLKELLENIRISGSQSVSINDIWTINPMPSKGFSTDDLASIDMSKAEEACGPKGETLRKMVSDTYHCETKEEEDYYIRRFLAS